MLDDLRPWLHHARKRIGINALGDVTDRSVTVECVVSIRIDLNTYWITGCLRRLNQFTAGFRRRPSANGQKPDTQKKGAGLIQRLFLP